MRVTVPTIAILGLSTALAFAQSAPASGGGAPAQNGPNNAAVKSMDTNNASAPVAGKNSFTMAQAKSHIEAKGYTNVTSLSLDDSGVWRGTAMKDGRSVPVSLDYQGNVN
jgi:hypothetical protein